MGVAHVDAAGSGQPVGYFLLLPRFLEGACLPSLRASESPIAIA